MLKLGVNDHLMGADVLDYLHSDIRISVLHKGKVNAESHVYQIALRAQRAIFRTLRAKPASCREAASQNEAPQAPECLRVNKKL